MSGIAWLLGKVIRSGALRLIDETGRTHNIGDGSPACCTLQLNQRLSTWRFLINPSLYMSEAYVDGLWGLAEGSLADFMALSARNWANLTGFPPVREVRRLRRLGERLGQYNPIGIARKNVAHHYDLSDRLFDLFLDADRNYSCAYFLRPDDSLERAQEQKQCHLAAKLLLDDSALTVLDIGSGWGGLGLYLAKAADCRVTGVTLSAQQHKASRKRARRAGLSDRVDFRLQDYRELDGKFDRIVSVGMFEHVGKRNYDEFFNRIASLLADDGVAVLHSIGRFDQPCPVNPFIRKHIFPGADVPCLSEVLASVEGSGLLATDVEVLRLHYAETLRLWRERFLKNRRRIAKIYDERFCRMWELYLAGCEMGFRYQGLMVFQLQLAKRQDALPLTREYMFEWERDQGEQQMQAAE